MKFTTGRNSLVVLRRVSDNRLEKTLTGEGAMPAPAVAIRSAVR